MIRVLIPDSDPDFLPIPDPGVKKARISYYFFLGTDGKNREIAYLT